MTHQRVFNGASSFLLIPKVFSSSQRPGPLLGAGNQSILLPRALQFTEPCNERRNKCTHYTAEGRRGIRVHGKACSVHKTNKDEH